MPEFTRLLPVLAVAGLLAACTATTPDAPPGDGATSAGATDAAAEATRRDGTGETAAAAPATLEDLSPEQQRQVQLFQQARQQILPCVEPRLQKIERLENAGDVRILVEYDENGAPLSADLPPNAPQRLEDNETYRAVVNAILNGINECAPLANMPKEEFDTWRLLPVIFRSMPT